jgi:anhydro-N-acetylmuramic acid kinase
MSGSSLDGLDIAYCRFDISKDEKQQLKVHDWQLLAAETIAFSEKWQLRLSQLPQQSALVFAKTHTYFGHYLGDMVNDFIQRHQIAPHFIASHGHTIFHDPMGRMTSQIGDGSAMAAITGYPVINGFRNQDIAINGEGAPVAPIVDKYLLAGHDFYLNLGGIANLTCILPSKIIAFDTCPANQLLNVLANQLGLEYDDRGQIAASGEVLEPLLQQLNQADFYQKPYPKSLDNAWSGQAILSQIENDPTAIPNQLCTLVEHIAYQIAFAIRQVIDKEGFTKEKYSLLATGGGALNDYLIERLKVHCHAFANIEVVLPSMDIIQFKEAVLMAWMGLMRLENVPNVMKSVTGAKRDSINGAIHQGWRYMV